ncbi:MAG TPA: hypothetical protein VFZ97_06025 [Acidimicrobiales bacterium]
MTPGRSWYAELSADATSRWVALAVAAIIRSFDTDQQLGDGNRRDRNLARFSDSIRLSLCEA